MAMQTIGHNIANVKTSEYTRQKAVLESQVPYTLELGLGVKVDSIVHSSTDSPRYLFPERV